MFCFFCPRRHTNRNSMFWMAGCGINHSCGLLQFKCCKIIVFIRTALVFSVDFIQHVMLFYPTGHRILGTAKQTIVVLRKILGNNWLFVFLLFSEESDLMLLTESLRSYSLQYFKLKCWKLPLSHLVDFELYYNLQSWASINLFSCEFSVCA